MNLTSFCNNLQCIPREWLRCCTCNTSVSRYNPSSLVSFVTKGKSSYQAPRSLRIRTTGLLNMSVRYSPKPESSTTISIVNSANHSLTFSQTYIAAVWPADDNDVTKAVQYARLRGIPFAPRGGGHCVSNTMKALQNGIMIDMRNFNQLSYNSAKELVTAGGGVLGGDFTQYLHSIKREVSKSAMPVSSYFLWYWRLAEILKLWALVRRLQSLVLPLAAELAECKGNMASCATTSCLAD